MTEQNEHDDVEKEKQRIENEQAVTENDIVEIDEAAQSAEGLQNRDTLGEGEVNEDREHLEDTAVDVPESDIVR